MEVVRSQMKRIFLFLENEEGEIPPFPSNFRKLINFYFIRKHV